MVFAPYALYIIYKSMFWQETRYRFLLQDYWWMFIPWLAKQFFISGLLHSSLIIQFCFYDMFFSDDWLLLFLPWLFRLSFTMFFMIVPRRWMVPLFVRWANARDKVQGKVVLSDLHITPTMSTMNLCTN